MVRLALLLILLSTSAAQSQSLVVNEILYDPPAPQPSDNEYVEVFNAGDETLDLTGLRLADARDTTAVFDAGSLAPGAYLVFVRDSEAFEAAYPDVAFIEVEGFPSLNNGGDTVAVLQGEEAVDSVPYLPNWGGADAALERISPSNPSDEASSFGTSTDPSGGTPGRQNSLFVVDTAPPELASVAVDDGGTSLTATFSEALDETSVQPGDFSLSGPSAPRIVQAQVTGSTVRLSLAAALTLGTYTLTASGVADRTGNVQTQTEAAFFFGRFDTPVVGEIIVNEIMYDPVEGGEYVEVLNLSAKTFDLGTLRIGDASSVAEVGGPTQAFEPGDYAVLVADGVAFASAFPDVPFVEVAGFPTLNNSGDTVRLLSGETTLDAVPYEPSWGGQDAALERIDPQGPSTRAFNFGTTTDARGGTPGAQNTLFSVDQTPPVPLAVTFDDAGQTLFVAFSEPLDSETVKAGNFALPGQFVTAATYTEDAGTENDDPLVTLTLATPLTPGDYTLTVSGVSDLRGTVQPGVSLAFAFVRFEAPAPGDLVVNEIMYSPVDSGEYVEILNASDQAFDLSRLALADEADTTRVTARRTALPAGGYAVLVADSVAFAAAFPEVAPEVAVFAQVDDFPTLNNSGDTVRLLFGDTTLRRRPLPRELGRQWCCFGTPRPRWPKRRRVQLRHLGRPERWDARAAEQRLRAGRGPAAHPVC